MSAIVDSLSNVIDFLPGATLLVDRDGNIRRCNESARQLLELVPGDSLCRIVADTDALRARLKESCRSSGSVPVAFTLTGSNQRISGTLKPVRDAPGEASVCMLLTCQTRDDAVYKMRMLNRELDRAIRQRRVLKQQNDTLRETVEQTLPRLKEQSFRDALTGSYNRRYFDRQLDREWRRAERQATPLSLVYADIDNFKQYNDAFGHREGDRCLQQVAQCLADALTRRFDCVCRLGGEEFALLLPMTPAAGAVLVAERAREAVRGLALEHPDNVADVVTASFGVGTCMPADGEGDPSGFVAEVDRAMYRAKRAGRDRIIVAADPGGASRDVAAVAQG